MLNFSLFTGITASVLHVISGPDHLAAVTPLAIETRRKIWKIGLFWGFGHLTGMLLIGILLLMFKSFIPLEEISEHSELLVGIVLIAIGLWALFRILYKTKSYKHEAEILNPTHSNDKKMKQHLWSSFGIGVLHGLAGIAHFILLLPVLGFENQMDSILYIVGFGIGTVFAMTLYTFLLGKITTYSKRQPSQSLYRSVRISGGLFAIGIGIYWLYLSF